MPAITTLLLDLDGTLVDTEPRHIEAHRQFLATVGIVPTEADLLGNIGKGDERFYNELMLRHGKTGNMFAWVAEKDRITGELYRSLGVPVRPGTHELLDHAFANGLACVVVTSSNRELATVALEESGLAARLPMRVCFEDTERHKPHPEPYALAASRLGVPPSACLAVEDSMSGISSAHAAGVQVVAAKGHAAAADQIRAGATRVIERLDELVPIGAQSFTARLAAAR
ncbi:MAG: HAD family hydrolase [Planctomycetota bacterium]